MPYSTFCEKLIKIREWNSVSGYTKCEKTEADNVGTNPRGMRVVVSINITHSGIFIFMSFCG